MKTTHILFAAVLAATSAIQAATAEHKLPAPLPEFKTPEQLAKWSEEMTAKAKAADALAAKQASSQSSTSAFYTGKPFDGDAGSYILKYRNYDPGLNRWTTTDPSGYPDGANAFVYINNHVMSSFDPNGLAEINTVPDSIVWYNTGKGENATAGSQLINGIKASGDYFTKISLGMEMSINMKLNGVDKTASNGTIAGSGSRGLDYGSVLGSYELNINYNSQWTASAWSNNSRTITSSVTLQLWINERYDFTPNSTYTAFQNLTREQIPGWIAEYSYPGQGTPYWIGANFTDTIIGTGYQTE
ncbi:MAG: RHS repeat-associated core domain-containing protein [Verrucomicrobiae bacterium]